MAAVNGINVPFVPIAGNNNSLSQFKIKDSGKSFDNLLNEQLNSINFSNHALKRLEERNINLSRESLANLNDAFDQAERKGSKDSLIMMDNNAFIINVPNKTVVTAMMLGEGEDIFTNIDSVIIK